MQYGSQIAQLIKDCPPLDVNSTYYYYIMCRDFSQSSCMALQGDQVIGYISGYFRPQKPGTLFVWQVAVSSSARGKGLAKSMLESILQRGKSKIQKVETTISPSNRASQKLFESFAKQLGRPLEKETFLSGKDFPAEGHEAEDLYHFSLF